MLKGKNMERFRSISFKITLLITVIILAVSAALVAVSARAFRQNVFNPREDKLNRISTGGEGLDKDAEYFLEIFLTEEFREARARDTAARENENPGGANSLQRWMGRQPGLNEEDEAPTMLGDWLIISDWVDRYWEANELESVSLEVYRDGTAYRIDERVRNGDAGVRARVSAVGEPESYFPDLAAEKYETSVRTRRDGKTLYLRCERIPLEGGGEYRAWMAFDMTEAFGQYRRFLGANALTILGLTVAVIIFSVIVMRRQVVRPIRGIALAARAFVPEADGTYSADRVSRTVIRTRDEVGELSRTIRSMQEQIVENTDNLARMTAERERIATEMNLARSIQCSALPGVFPAFPDRTEFDLYASMTPATEVGGDFYDFFLIDDDHLALVIADVAGKGIPAAMFMMKAKTAIKSQLLTGCDPAKALERVNLQLCDGNASKIFVTVWLAVLKISTGRGLACNAGHECPALRRAGSSFELLWYDHDKILGVIQKAKYHNRPFELHPGDCVFVCTDGITEAMDSARELFGRERLTDTLNLDAAVPPEELVRRMYEEVESFAGGVPQSDDITMLCLRYNGGRAE